MPWKRVAFRLAIVSLVFLAAAAVPDLGALISLLGALTGSVLALIAPGVINFRCPRPDRRRWEPYADVFVIVVGFVGGVFGTYQAFLNVIRDPDAILDAE
uniref:Amino acid transporter transmembrane domain-containing protein n=2 Tax=Octactis speculum TaxID=3111310 RepID=A0A7S2D9T8_9STRA|mmetsp:Transcript_4584/g.5486  ORF Transcript_4584/g.5486 Transcript_4584/m.5486 type:complete len:100 (+) Transcript_4584:37-336(+)